ncbi:MAG: hypothetical protein V4613_04010 [Bacteroidota bacterium]
MNLRQILITILLLTSISVFGTGQLPDLLIYNKQTYSINGAPLENYLAQKGNKSIPGLSGGCSSTDCWKGYVATWELKNDSLFLRHISPCNYDCGHTSPGDLKKMFGTDTVFASWFTGDITIFTGNQLKRPYISYSPITENTQIFDFVNGKVTTTKLKSNIQWYDTVSPAYRQTMILKHAQDSIFSFLTTETPWAYNDTILHFDQYILNFNKSGYLIKIKSKTKKPKMKAGYYPYRNLRKRLERHLKTIHFDYMNPDMKFTISIQVFLDSKQKQLVLLNRY